MIRSRLLLYFILVAAVSMRLYSQTSNSTRTQNLSTHHARHSEDWVRHGIIYEIYPRSFSPEGNFEGIEKRLPELQKLGVTILWLMPIHPVGMLQRKGVLGSPYSVQDYYGINPEFGTLSDFKRLVMRAHELGFHLIIDLVANHTAWDSKLIKEHPEWFTKDSAGAIISPNPDWTDVADLDYSQPGLRRYMIEMMKYWVGSIGVDGFRCDAAELVPTDFWESARAALDSIRPVMLLSEGSFPEHHVKAFDATYSWNIYHKLAPIMKGKNSARALDAELMLEDATFPKGSLRMRFSSNHDENAWDSSDVDKFGVDGAKLAAVIVNTLPGIPLLYNGQEIGNRKKLGVFDKYSIEWKDGDEFRTLYSRLFELRKNNPALSEGSMIRIPSTNDERVYTFARVSGTNKFIVAVNFDLKPFTGSLSLMPQELAADTAITLTDVFTNKTLPITIPASHLIPIEIPAMGFRVFQVQLSNH